MNKPSYDDSWRKEDYLFALYITLSFVAFGIVAFVAWKWL